MCPCAFSIAMPAALAAATAHLARLGVLVVRLDSLETLAKISRCIFDKTGTLTRGELQLSRYTVSGQIVDTKALAIAAALEQASEHPIARAFSGLSTQDQHVEHPKTIPGCGIEGWINGRLYRIGTENFVAELRGTGS